MTTPLSCLIVAKLNTHVYENKNESIFKCLENGKKHRRKTTTIFSMDVGLGQL